MKRLLSASMGAVILPTVACLRPLMPVDLRTGVINLRMD